MLRAAIDVMRIAARQDCRYSQLRGVFGKRISLLTAHQAIDQREIDRLARQSKPRFLGRRRGGHSMADCGEKFGHDRLHVGVIFDEQDVRHS